MTPPGVSRIWGVESGSPCCLLHLLPDAALSLALAGSRSGWVWGEGRGAQGRSSYQKLRSRIKGSVQEKREGTQGCGLRAGFLFCRRNGMESAPPPSPSQPQSRPCPPPLRYPSEVYSIQDHSEVTPSIPFSGFPPASPAKVRGV